MEITDGEHARRAGQGGADFGPKRGPAIESGAEELKGIGAHLLMLVGQVRFDDGHLAGEPFFKILSCFVNVFHN